ncbi:MAG: gliding motility-associated C-terminal domain-containing protein [Bacteroidia bacterium]|nr:gliding motility-associated C-terminal domain-containing protein [Bacteroidia bacterium]
MRLIRLLLLFFFGLPLAGVAQQFHVRCLSVGNTGDVTVTWDRNGLSPADFRCYYLYHSTSAAGPFSPIDSIFIYGDTSEVHATALANTNPAWYYLAFKSASGAPDILSDTASAIFLNVINPNSGFAVMNWNTLRDPLIATNSVYYRLYREFPTGIFTLIDSVDASLGVRPMTYNDLIAICNDTVRYRIEVADQGGCTSRSNRDGENFRDLLPPEIPQFDSVSVDGAGNIVMGWSQNTSPDTRYYEIQINTGSSSAPVWTPLDTAFGIGTTYLNSGIDGTGAPRDFKIVAVDSCGNQSAQSVMHSSLQVQVSFLICEKAIEILCTSYGGWGVAPVYECYRSANGGPEVLIATGNSSSFRDTNIVSGTNYCYKVRAIDPSNTTRTSTSYRKCITPVFPPPPAYSYIRKVSVLEENTIRIEGYVDPVSPVSGYELLRAASAAGPFTSIAFKSDDGTDRVVFFDNPSTEQVWYYKIVTIDSCGLQAKESQVSRSMVATAAAEGDFTNFVSWTDYGDWLGGIDRFDIYRRINGTVEAFPIATIPYGATAEYRDSVLRDFLSDGEFCYIIEAIEGAGNPYFFLDSVRSNEVCVYQEPFSFIPNAFHPGGGINETFRPFNGFVNPEGYKFIVFNRWGEEIFVSDNPQQSWDGASNGKLAPPAVYIYLIEYNSPEGGKRRKLGTITLIR